MTFRSYHYNISTKTRKTLADLKKLADERNSSLMELNLLNEGYAFVVLMFFTGFAVWDQFHL